MSHQIIKCLFTILILLPSASHADWINLSGAMSADNIAEFHVSDNHVKVVLEIYVRDLSTFLDLVPDTMLKSAAFNDLFRIYSTAKNDNIDFNYIGGPSD